MIGLYLLSALIMILLEYFVLLRLYTRSRKLEIISLVVAPLIIILGLWITLWIQPNGKRVNPLILFLVIAAIELPLSLYGYELQPNASILERVIVAGTFGVASVLIAESILLNY